MTSSKKSKNIFGYTILPESLFYEEDEKEYTIGGSKVEGCWLKGAPSILYRTSVKSAFELSELKAQYDTIKQNNSSRVDMFRLAELKKKINNFELLEQSPIKKSKNSNLDVKAENLKLQKLSKFWGLFERNCKLIDNQITVESQKEKIEKTFNLKEYTLELEEKGKTLKESEEFVWIGNDPVRLFLHGANLRPYCLYGNEETLKNITKKIKIERTQINQIEFFRVLEKQLFNKTIILFGNKLRVYEHHVQQKEKNNLNIAFDLLEKTNLIEDSFIAAEKYEKEKVGGQAVWDESVKLYSEDSSNSKKRDFNIFGSVFGSPIKGAVNESQFRMRARRSTINYEELEYEDKVLDYKIGDLKLEIKEETYSDENAGSEVPGNQSEEEESSPFVIGEIREPVRRPKRAFMEEMGMSEFSLEDDSDSEEISIVERKKSEDVSSIKTSKESYDSSPKFILKPIKKTHYIYIGYFQDFCHYPSSELEITLFQKIIPEFESANMKTEVCALEKIFLHKDPKTDLYVPDKFTQIELSKEGKKIGIIFNNKVREIIQEFDIDLNKILYAVDQSELLYLKYENRIQCAGKLKIIISTEAINPRDHLEETTCKFLERSISKENRDDNQKYRFIDYKRRHCEINQKWNGKMMKRIIHKKNNKEFHKSVFYGFNSKVYDKMLGIFEREKNGHRVCFGKVQSAMNFFSQDCYRMIEDELIKLKVYDLRVYLKITRLLEILINSVKNKHLTRRIEETSTYFSFKFGKDSVEKFYAVYIIETLRKLENLLLQLKNANQIEMLLEEYFEVEYEIDEVMDSVLEYFN